MRSITWQLIVHIIELAASWMASLHEKLKTTSAELCRAETASRQLEWWIGFWKDTGVKLSPQRPLSCTSRTNLDPKSRIANENAQSLTRYGDENPFHVFHVHPDHRVIFDSDCTTYSKLYVIPFEIEKWKRKIIWCLFYDSHVAAVEYFHSEQYINESV